MDIKFKHLIMPIILVVAVTIGLLFYQKQNQKENSNSNSSKSYSSEQSSGIVLGDSDSSTSNSSQITSGEVYLSQINAIRNEIIKDINELNSRMKYKNVFDDKAILQYIEEILEKNSAAIEKMKGLDIASKFATATEKNIQSLQYISDALSALKKSYTVEDKQEAQKQRELFAYDLEQSDSVYKGIQIPK